MAHKQNALFIFLRYVNPLWYHNHAPAFASFPNIADSDIEKLGYEKCLHYRSLDAIKRDISYQAFLSGYISLNSIDIRKETTAPDVIDNYIFIRRYFHPFWAFYIIIARLISFHDPIQELYGFFNSISAKRITVKNVDWIERFDKYRLQSFHRKVCVVIPTLNRYRYLANALRDLEPQTYKNFEVIVIDQNDNPDSSFYKQFNLKIKLIIQKEKALWQARNTAIKTTDAELILLYDDDSRVDDDWIESHIKCIDMFDVEISSGASISAVGAKVPQHYSIFRIGDQVDTGNAMVKKEVFYKVGLFDTQFEKQRMGDGEFGFRCHLNGVKNINNPIAKRLHLKAETGGLRQMGSWDGIRPKSLFAPRPIPSVLYFTRGYVGNKLTFLYLSITIPMSLVPYRWKGNNFMIAMSYLLIIVVWPLIAYQVVKSWHLSSIKLKNGPSIEKLHAYS